MRDEPIIDTVVGPTKKQAFVRLVQFPFRPGRARAVARLVTSVCIDHKWLLGRQDVTIDENHLRWGEYRQIWSPRENWQTVQEIVWDGEPWGSAFDDLDEALVQVVNTDRFPNEPFTAAVRKSRYQIQSHVSRLALQYFAAIQYGIGMHVNANLDELTRDHQYAVMAAIAKRLGGLRRLANKKHK